MPRAIVPNKGLRKSSQAAAAVIDAQQALADLAEVNQQIEDLWYDEEALETLAQEAHDYAVAAQSAIAQLDREVDASFDSIESRVDGVVADLEDFISVADVTYATKQEVDEATGTITQTIEANYATKEENNANTAVNITPFYECEFERTEYWKNYGQGNVTRLYNGWARVSVNNTGSSDITIPAFTAPVTDIKAASNYTLRVDVRNVTITRGTGVQIYGASVISGGMSQFALVEDPFWLVERDLSYLVPLRSRDASSLAQATFGTRTYYRVPSGSQVTFEIRLSLFEGTYTGMWKAYAGDTLYTTKTVLQQTSNSILQQVASNYVDVETGATLATKTEVTTAVNGVRTYVETNYALQEDLASNVSALANYITSNDAAIAELQTQIDGAIETWFYNGVPTLSNLPASQWNTTEKKNVHLGDLYYDGQSGKAYRFQMSGQNYVWQEIADTDVARALQMAQGAQDTADSKRRVFVAQPVPPYDVGDLWVQGTSGDILRCKTAKASGTQYVAADWVKASKYTDDTAANAVATNLQTNYYTKTEQDVTDSSIRQSVTENLQTAKTYADGLIQTEVSNRNSAITQTASSIRQEVSETYTTLQQFNALEIGGRNLLRNSGDFLDVKTWVNNGATPTLVTEDGYPCIYAEGSITKVSAWGEGFVDIEPNEVYVYHSMIKFNASGSINVSQPMHYWLFKASTAHSNGVTNVPYVTSSLYVDSPGNLLVEAGKWHHIVWIFSAPFDSSKPYVTFKPFIYGTSVVDISQGYYLRWMMLEKATKPSGWSPAPEDTKAIYATSASLEVKANEILSTVSQTYQLQGDYPTKTEMNSAINQSASSITSTVSQTYLTKANASSTYLTQANASSTYLSQTDASGTYLAQTDAANTYLTQSDASNTYATQTSVQSQIEQTASSITSTVSQTYLTKTNAASTYLTKTDASNTYITPATVDSKIEQSASNITSTVSATYLTKTSAASTYLGKTDASSTYLSKSDAASTYITPSSVDSKIEQSASSITSTVAATYATKTALDDVQVLASREGLIKYEVDLVSLDQNTWYPVVISRKNDSTNNRIRFVMGLQGYGGGYQVSWSNHQSKAFSISLSAEYVPSVWGWLDDKVSYIDDCWFGFTNGIPVTLSNALDHSNCLVVYMRGGVKYPFYSNGNAPYLVTSSYTLQGQTVSPTTTQPSNTSNFVVSRRQTQSNISTIEQTVSGITTRVQSAEGNISTLQQTASGLRVDLTQAISNAAADATSKANAAQSAAISAAATDATSKASTAQANAISTAAADATSKANAAQAAAEATASADATAKANAAQAAAETNAAADATAKANAAQAAAEATAAADATAKANAAKKVATDYLNFSSSGLDVGYSGTSAKTRINTSGVYIYNASGTVVGSWEGSTARIGPRSGWNQYLTTDGTTFYNNEVEYLKISTGNSVIGSGDFWGETWTNYETGAIVMGNASHAYRPFIRSGAFLSSSNSGSFRLEQGVIASSSVGSMLEQSLAYSGTTASNPAFDLLTKYSGYSARVKAHSFDTDSEIGLIASKTYKSRIEASALSSSAYAMIQAHNGSTSGVLYTGATVAVAHDRIMLYNGLWDDSYPSTAALNGTASEETIIRTTQYYAQPSWYQAFENARIGINMRAWGAWKPAFAFKTQGGGSWSLGNYDTEKMVFNYVASGATSNDSAKQVYLSHSRGGHILVGNDSAVGSLAYLSTAPIANGGTGATTAAAARTNLGLGSLATKSSLVAGDIPALSTNKLTSGTLPRGRGGTGLTDAGVHGAEAFGTDSTAAAANTWYNAGSISVPAGRCVIIAKANISCGATAGTGYVRLTSDNLSTTKTEDPNYQDTEMGLGIYHSEGANRFVSVHIMGFVNNSSATTYYLHWKSISTTTTFRAGRISYMKVAAS